MSRRRCEDAQGPSAVTRARGRWGERARRGLTVAAPALGLGRVTHRIMAEELTVAAVTELPISLVGGGRGAGAPL